MPPEEDDAGNEAGDGDDNGRQQGEDAGDDELRVEEAAARDGADEQVAEATPVRLFRDSGAREGSDDDD